MGPMRERVFCITPTGRHSMQAASLPADLTEKAKCPVLTNLKKAPDILNEDGLALLALEKTATDLHALAYPNPIYRGPNLDFIKPMVIL